MGRRMAESDSRDQRGGYPYRDLVRAPYVARLLGGTLLGRLPNGMGALAIALFVRAHGGDYTLAGALSAAYVLMLAAGQPVLGRAMDRFGQPHVLLFSATAAAVGFAGLAAIGLTVLPLAVAAIMIAGFATPPLESGLRAVWPQMLGSQERIRAAYALDAASQETIFTVGPLLVSASAAVSVEAALLLTGLLGMVGTLVVASSSPARRWRGARRVSDWAGPLRSPGLRVLIGALVCVGGSFGVVEFAVVSYADARHAPGIAGVLLAANSAGALCAGLIYGARGGVSRLPWLVAGLCGACVPLTLAPPLPLMVPLSLIGGVFIAPVFACTFTLINGLAPRGTVTEAFGWLVAAIAVGAAIGSSIAGVLGDLAGVQGAFAGSAPLAALALVVLLLGRHALQPRTRHPRTSQGITRPSQPDAPR
jgi:MFS family permease